MFFRFINQLLVAGIYLTCNCMPQKIENNSLIYDYDINHKMNLYCQFAPAKELNNLPSIETKCLDRNRNMVHILADGTKTYPFAPFGSRVGFVLKCGNITNGNLKPRCSRYVYTNCSYTCGTSEAVHIATCILMGPQGNVTAQWSLTEPCTVPHLSSGFLGPTSPSVPEHEVTSWGPVTGSRGSSTSANGIAGNITANGTARSLTSTSKIAGIETTNEITSSITSASEIASIALSSGDMSDEMTIVVVVVAASVVIVLVMVVVLIVLCRRRRRNKRRSGCQTHHQTCNGHSQNNLEDLPQDLSAEEDDKQQLPTDSLIEHKQNPEVIEVTGPAQPKNQGFTDLPDLPHLPDWRSLSDHNFAENNNQSKGMADKNPIEELEKWSEMDPASLENICFQDLSGTVTYSKPQHVLPANPDECNATVELLKNQTNSYRKWLRAELEVIPGRSRERALVGYMEENAGALGYMPNEIKLLEKSYETQVEEKVSDEFLHKLAAHGVKLGSIVKYFHLHGNREAITAITRVHKDCPFCGQLQRL